jgi:hypothetical protein
MEVAARRWARVLNRRPDRPVIFTTLAACLLGQAASGCATQAAETRTPDAAHADAAEVDLGADPMALSRRVYELGEAAWSGGAKIEAVALWRQAFLSLPPAPEYDALRHRMVVRIGHGLLELHRLDADLYHLEAGRQMLQRWLDMRAGEDESAARDEAYALLGEFELRIAEPPMPSRADDEHDEGELSRARMLAAYDGAQADYRSRDLHSGEEVDAQGIHRQIEVDGWARFDDPRVQAYLRHPNPLGPSLFDRSPDPFNPTRPLVRAGVPKLAVGGDQGRRDARKETWRILRQVRPELELCYARSMGRAPTEVVKMKVTIEVDASGQVSAARSDGDALGDAIGDDCLRRSFDEARVEAGSLRGQRLAVLPLTFFIQPETFITPTAGIVRMHSNMEGPSIGDAETKYQLQRVTFNDRGTAAGRR